MKPHETMKRIIALTKISILLIAVPLSLGGQSSFDAGSYKSYLDENKNLTAEQLLSKNAPQTAYYSSRTHPASLENIPWFDSIDRVFNLTAAEKELLGKNFFVVTERLRSTTWTEAFIRGYNNDLPLFISTDFILFTLHNSYDNILLSLEWQLLEPNLMDLLDAMYLAFPALEKKYSVDPRFEDALDDADLFISVARSLLYEKEFLPQSQSHAKYTEIMAFIEAEQMVETTLFTQTRMRKVDFSQFTPRGHYTRPFWSNGTERTLENYFRAMMWLGRIDFLLTAPPSNPWEPDWEPEELQRMQLGALLVNELLWSCGKKGNLDFHEKIISFMVGPDDNMTPDELNNLSTGLLSSPADLFKPHKFAEFSANLNASDDYGQKIMSNFFYVDPYSEDPGQLPVSYKLLGQKFLIDSYVFSEVVFDRIISNGVKIWRGLPDPLDAMAVLGNEDAMALLEDELEEYKYAYKIDALKYLVDSYDEEFWEQSLYNTWLGAITDLNPPRSSEMLPYFMQTTAWHHEKLNTQLCSWAELRHDNLLYAKQSYTGGTACSFPFSYVEPYPDFYRRLRTFADNASTFFYELNQQTETPVAGFVADYYKRFSGYMNMFEGISIKELEGTPLSMDEITFLKTMINSFMASGPSVDGWLERIFYDPWKGLDMDFAVADVHTQPTDYGGARVGKVLHVGNGMINRGVFLAPNPANPDQLMAFTGPVASFHYEVTRNFKRLTDEEWRDKFLYNNLPPRPDWVAEYLADENGSVSAAGRKLKGGVYTGTMIPPIQSMNTLDYLLAFPNPAGEEFHLRFVLNRKSSVHAVAYDASGRLVKHLHSGILSPAEHDIPVNTTGWTPGLYIIRFSMPGEMLTRKVMIR